MKLLINGLIFLLLSKSVFAKCWSVTELPPTYCVELKVKKVILLPDCIASATLKLISIPRADLQNLKAAVELKSRSETTVKIDSKSCPTLKSGAVLKGVEHAF